jgi:glycosyltransferase involved in cell wall biosynthesis
LKQLNVAVLAVDFLPTIGGISLMTHHLSNALCRSGMSIRVIAPLGANVPQGYEADYQLEVDSEARPRLREGKQSLAEDARVRKLLERLAEDSPIDRVLIMHPFYYATGAIAFAKKYGIPSSIFFYGFELNSLLIMRPPGLLRRYSSHFLNGSRPTLAEKTYSAIDHTSEILAISHFTANLVGRVNAKRKIYITGCGLSAEDIRRGEAAQKKVISSREQLLEKYGIKTQHNVSFCARLVECKGAHLLLKALSKIANPRVGALIIGDGPELENLKKQAVNLKMENVHFFPAVDDITKFELMGLSNVFCLPSYPLATGQVEGFGIVLLEAAAAGVPVIASRAGGMVDVVEHGVTGYLFDPQNAADLSAKILTAMERNNFSASLVKAARQQIMEKFNWKSIAENIRNEWIQ